MSELVLPIATGTQGLLFLFDEFYFHRNRSRLRWELWSHPADVFSVMVFLSWLLFGPVGTSAYDLGSLLLGALSCLLITKDEFIHRQVCSGGEAWIHSLQFLLHPVVLFLCWRQQLEHQVLLKAFFAANCALFFSLLIFAVFRWKGSDARI